MKEVKNITIEKKTAERFQQFSRTHYRTHTEAITGMLDFFLYNEISPKEKIGPTAKTIEKLINKRINAVIAIIKDIEKNQTKPTIGILQALLEQEEPKKKPLLVEKKRPSVDRHNYREFNR
jgi:hypothetical protein